MTQGFAAHLVDINGVIYKNTIVMVDGACRFTELRPLDRETPFTRFFDGMLKVVSHNEKGEPADVKSGDTVSVWQWNPYDLFGNKETAETRKIRIL